MLCSETQKEAASQPSPISEELDMLEVEIGRLEGTRLTILDVGIGRLDNLDCAY